MSGLVPSAKNSTLYAELINNQSEIVLRAVFPASLGATWGQLELPESIPAGFYQLRAYSPLMLNQPGFVFHKRISIFGKESKKKKRILLKIKARYLFSRRWKYDYRLVEYRCLQSN
ncbi:hypothetical protein [Niabella ginsengisoli]|uniref:Uncharacterized protein n=1 Tax=Niabella ginsengisoli TaxID=522298 RepID=A0ABS9SGU9_9BACT|nr:hypothetical protein [Niabella ginsengisoli]MCH5597594.1 hypothetical protein [Niabella ginsengisoli]